MTLRKATRPAFALCIGFLLGCHSSSAQSPDAETRISVALRPGLSLEEARRLPDRAWVPVESGRLRFSQVHDLWVRLEIKPHTLENELFVSLGPPRADRIDAYALEDGRLYSVVTAGDRQPFRSPVPALALPRSPHERVSVAYVRFRNATSNALNVSVVNAAQRQAILRGRSLALGLAGGAYASLAAFVATLFFLTRNRAFAYYFVFMGVAAYVVSSQNGLLHEYLFPDGGRPLNGMVRVMAAIGLASTMAFSRRFLEFPKLTIPVRLARALTLFVQWAGILLAPLFLFFESPLFFVLLGIVVPFAALVLVLMGFLAQRHHVYQSGAFSLGWTLVFAGTLWRFLDESGLVPSTPIGSQGLGVSFLLEAFVFTFALARRGRRILHETEHARDRLARIEGELGQAREIQARLLPKPVQELHGVRVTSRYLPESTIGGDFYAVHDLGHGQILILVADVTGHGLAAALDASSVWVAFRNAIDQERKPNLILEQMNAQLAPHLDFRLVSATCLVVDTLERELLFSNAGQTLAALFDNNTCRLLDGPGYLMGLAADTSYTLQKLALPDHGRLCAFSDGLFESRVHTKSFEAAMAGALSLTKTLSGDACADEILDFMQQWRAEEKQSDDITLVLLEW